MNIFKTRIVQIHLYICVNKLTNGIKPALIRNFNFLREKKDQPWIPKLAIEQFGKELETHATN